MAKLKSKVQIAILRWEIPINLEFYLRNSILSLYLGSRCVQSYCLPFYSLKLCGFIHLTVFNSIFHHVSVCVSLPHRLLSLEMRQTKVQTTSCYLSSKICSRVCSTLKVNVVVFHRFFDCVQRAFGLANASLVKIVLIFLCKLNGKMY